MSDTFIFYLVIGFIYWSCYVFYRFSKLGENIKLTSALEYEFAKCLLAALLSFFIWPLLIVISISYVFFSSKNEKAEARSQALNYQKNLTKNE